MTGPRQSVGDTAASTDGDDAHVVDGVNVDALVAAVTSCPSVSGMAVGGPGSAVTLLPGRRVPGARVTNGEVQVDVRARWGATAAMLGREVHAATRTLLAGHSLHVLITDIDDPGAPAAAPDASADATPVARADGVPASALPAAPELIALPATGPHGSAADNPSLTFPLTTESGATAASAPDDPTSDAIDPSDRPASPS